MKRKVILLGGTGNVLFQIMKLQSICGNNYEVCDFFIKPFVRQLFRHTDHSNDYRRLVKIGAKSDFFLPLLILDIFICKIFNVTFFSVFDLNFVKTKRVPFLFDWFYFGYFQEKVDVKGVYDNKNVLNVGGGAINEVLIHIRGGDFSPSGDVFTNRLEGDYYKKAICRLKEEYKVEENYMVVTNDIQFSKEISGYLNVKFQISNSKDALEDFLLMNCSKVLICSNSTFSLMAALTNSELELLILPSFFKEKFYGFDALPYKVVFV